MNRKFVLILALTLLIGMLNVAFNVQRAKASGTVYIRADGSIEPSDAPISTFDNVTYTLTGNIASDADGIVVERSDIIIDGAGYTVQGTGSGTGIYISGRSNVTIKNTTIKAFYHGIWLDSSSPPSARACYNSVSGNNITANNGDGILLYSSSNDNSISGNNITANYYYGIELSYSSNNSISGNHITNNRCGIVLDSSGTYDNSISGNNITANYYYGIELSSSNYNSVSGNNIANNNDGIRLTVTSGNSISGNNITANNEYGIHIHYAYSESIFHNNFINNNHQVWSGDSLNTWDDGYPSGGNYWSDYEERYPNATEITDSGIWNTPYVIYAYVIDANNTDNYPLMGMFSDFNATSAYHVQTICNSTISNFHFNGTAICFNVSGQSGTAGFCRICIPRVLMNSTYEVFVNGTKVQCNELICLICSNSTHAYLYFNYTHSTKEVIIIPEFQSFLILPLFMIATLLAVIAYRRRKVRCGIPSISSGKQNFFSSTINVEAEVMP